MAEMRPTPTDRVLDVGVTNSGRRSSNFLEALYPWPDRITAVALEPMPEFNRLFPAVRFVTADARRLPFPDDTFDIGFSNAVIEHVGSRDEQRRHVEELLRTCRRVLVATPNARFPVDPHTLLPVVHWLPRGLRHPLLRLTGNSSWASEATLNPLDRRTLASLFPSDVTLRVVGQRMFGLTSVLIAIAMRDAHDVRSSTVDNARLAG
jgi:SAM-dependent methyltransferase